jgi:kinesin family member 3A
VHGAQVLHGGVNLLEKVDELKKRSESTKRELEIQRRQEEEQRRRVQELEVQQMDFSEKFSSLEARPAVICCCVYAW